MNYNCVKLICPQCSANFHHPADETVNSTGSWPLNCPSCTDARVTELTAALEAITERTEDVADKIHVEKRSEGVSQAQHVNHMANHLAQHAKIARTALAQVKHTRKGTDEETCRPHP